MSIDKREQVFVSSTYLDLQEERQAVIQTLLQADCFPAGMEFFPASSDEKWDLIKRVIEDSDYYLVVVGGRYGSQTEDGLSYTEKEFDYAVEKKKPIMAFLHGSPGSIAVDNSDIDPAVRLKLEHFREKAGKRMVKFWRTPGDLAANVALSLIQSRKTHPVEGWIRAKHAITPEIEIEMVALKRQVFELTEALNSQQNAMENDDESDYESGNDTHSLNLILKALTEEQILRGRSYDAQSFSSSILVTWDELFACIGPRLIDEGSEWTITKSLN